MSADNILDELKRVKAELDAIGPILLGVRLHPADALEVQRATTRNAEPHELMFAPELFITTRVGRGTPEYAYDRDTLEKWRKEGA